jgi:hypothetical protein
MYLKEGGRLEKLPLPKQCRPSTGRNQVTRAEAGAHHKNRATTSASADDSGAFRGAGDALFSRRGRNLENLNIEIIFSQSPFSIFFPGLEIVIFGSTVGGFNPPPKLSSCLLGTRGCFYRPEVILRRHAFVGL